MKNIKRIFAMLLALVLFVGTLPLTSLSVSAASNWPSLSASHYCEMIAHNKIPVYKDTGLKTRGTCSPSQSYNNAHVAKGDKIYILQVSANYTKLSYPVSGGSRRIGYVSTASLFGVKAPTEMVTGKAKVTTYTGTSTSQKSGCTAIGDTVYKLGTTSGFVLIMYSAASGSRSYKAAFCTKSDYANILGKASGNTSSKTSTAVQNRLDAIGNGSLRYNANTVMKIGSKFTGYRAGEQCKGFAKNVFYLCFGITANSTQSRSKGLNYLLNNTTGMTKLGSVTHMTASNISKLFSNARPGDFVQIRRNHGGSHSAIVYSVSATGVTFFEANLDGNNTVYLRTYTWDQLCKQNAAMSVYTAKNYKLK